VAIAAIFTSTSHFCPILVLGVLSYGHYLRGGDPGALWKNVASSGTSRIMGVLNGTIDGAKRQAEDAVASVSRNSDDSSSAGTTEVFTWQDENGVTHFSQVAPAGVSANSVTVNPNVNVLAPIRSLNVQDPSDQNKSASVTPGASSSDDLQAIGGMPGIAGQLPNLGGANPDNNKAAQEQLIKMLQRSQ